MEITTMVPIACDPPPSAVQCASRLVRIYTVGKYIFTCIHQSFLNFHQCILDFMSHGGTNGHEQSFSMYFVYQYFRFHFIYMQMSLGHFNRGCCGSVCYR